MGLIGGISKSSPNYIDIQIQQDDEQRLMTTDTKKYIKLMTYKIINYLSMVSRIYVRQIKINWIVNEINNVYIQDIFDFQESPLPLKIEKFRLPPK